MRTHKSSSSNARVARKKSFVYVRCFNLLFGRSARDTQVLIVIRRLQIRGCDGSHCCRERDTGGGGGGGGASVRARLRTASIKALREWRNGRENRVIFQMTDWNVSFASTDKKDWKCTTVQYRSRWVCCEHQLRVASISQHDHALLLVETVCRSARIG